MSKFQGSKINPTRYSKSQIPFYIVLLPLAVFMALPIVYIFSTALKPMDELFAFPPRFLVRRPTWDNFRELNYMFNNVSVPFSRYMFNSLASSLVIVIATIFLSVSGSFALSKKRFKAKAALFAINTAALMFVPVVVRIPRYLIVEKLGLLDSFAILILPMVAMPIGLFLIKQYMDQVPDALIEAARIDGANDFYILWRIVTPVIMPAIATVAIISFQTSWNTAEAATYYVNVEHNKTFAYYITLISTAAGNNVAAAGISAASSLILFIPNFIIFLAMQSKVINTMAHSGIK